MTMTDLFDLITLSYGKSANGSLGTSVQTKPTVIGGDSYPLGQADSHQQASLSFR
jgi:hypothetical protein